MNTPPPGPPATKSLSDHKVVVLLVDDQAMVGEAVRRMLAGEPDIQYHYCGDPAKAVALANELRPTVILQDLVMPEIDGLMLVKFFRANPTTRETPLIVLSTKEEPVVKAEAFAIGANDYLVKLPDRIELLARIRYHSKGYIHLLERNEAYRALEASEQRLAAEMAAAARYVQSLLPKPATEPVKLDWRFVPSAELAGDSFGYHWLDADHLAIYLLDVSGHGLGAALLSVTALNVLRSQSLPNTDFRQPAQVLSTLNDTFKMDDHEGKFFTIWYGVYNRPARRLAWCGAGHPAALLFPGEVRAPAAPVRPVELESNGPVIGLMPWSRFENAERDIPPGSRLYVFSDGAVEIHKPDGSVWSSEEFLDFISQPLDGPAPPMDRLIEHVRQLHGSDSLDDDLSMIEVRF